MPLGKKIAQALPGDSGLIAAMRDLNTSQAETPRVGIGGIADLLQEVASNGKQR
jgi:hypothetical protein